MKRILVAAIALACFAANATVEVYFLRHGETTWNRERRLQGSISHPDLTERGVKMAEATARGMKAAGVKLDRVYTSPYRRAAHTAEIIADGTGAGKPTTDARLREMCFGKYEGMHYVRGQYTDENMRCFFEDPEKYVPQGKGAETFDEVGRRLRDFLENEIKPLDGKCERVLCVAHSLVLKSIVREILGKNAPESARKTIQRNCCVHILKYENGRFSLQETGKIFYNPDEF